MEIISMHHKLQIKQIEFVERYLDFVKEWYKFEIALNGQISQADLLMNEILDHIDNLDMDQIIQEEQNLYKKILIKRYAQNTLSSNHMFKNIFKSKNLDELDERTSLFLEKNKKLLETGKCIGEMFTHMDGAGNEPE